MSENARLTYVVLAEQLQGLRYIKKGKTVTVCGKKTSKQDDLAVATVCAASLYSIVVDPANAEKWWAL